MAGWRRQSMIPDGSWFCRLTFIQDSLVDMLSVLGMTCGDEDRLETLKYRLLARSNDLGSWGHEYIRHLALEIGQEYQNRLTDEKEVEELVELSLCVVPYF